MLIRSIHHISLIVADLERSLEFYNKMLGIPLDTGRPEMDYQGAWLAIAEQQIHLLQLPNPDPITGRPAHGGRDRHLALSVDNLDVLTARLQQNSIPYSLSKSGRRAAFCRDPDANALEFVEI